MLLAVRIALIMALDTQSAAEWPISLIAGAWGVLKNPERSGNFRLSVAMQKIASPSNMVWDGRMARAIPS
jgi:hypothetical protein